MKYIFSTLLLAFYSLSFSPKTLAQSAAKVFKIEEDSLIQVADSMNRVATLNERIDYCHAFIKKLGHVLKQPNSFGYPFDELGKKVHIIYPEDKSFRIFNWPVEYEPARFRYYGAIQMANGKIFPLVDNSEELGDKGLMGQLSSKNWFGQEYYKIISLKDEAGAPLYFLFGMNLSRETTALKMMDALHISDEGVTFGGNYFGIGTPRFILEYSKGAQASLNYDAEQGMVIYNVLESEVNQPLRKSTLVPNGDLNGMKWTGGQWQLIKNLIPIQKLKDGQAPINGVVPTN